MGVRVRRCLFPGWSAMAQSWLTATSDSRVQGILLPQSPELLGLQAPATTPVEMRFRHVSQAEVSSYRVSLLPRLQCNETGFHHVGQAGLELLTSGDPSVSVSQSAENTGVSHCAWWHQSKAGEEKALPYSVLRKKGRIQTQVCVVPKPIIFTVEPPDSKLLSAAELN
ncbi:hypothetical protein AAY473_027731 [Plecturocebus cupreus]